MHRLLKCCRLALVSLVLAGPVSARAGTETPEVTGRAAGDEVAALRHYVAGVVDALRRRGRIPGVVVAVVRADRVLLAEGYGHARLDPPQPADATRSLFRIGSISKTFTYTAAMQLVERGVIALDDPVNQHLPVPLQVPDDGFPEPVRVRHLLSHTAGFEDLALGHLFERDPREVRRLDDYLAQERPRRVRAPDTAAVYSNYSVALLGALVAHRSGMPFEDYVEHHLTGPLGMQRTTFREPLPPDDPRRVDAELAADIATGYGVHGGGWRAATFEYVAHGAPAGSASASASDMARWMRVHLNGGELDGVRILSRDTAQRMRTLMFRNAADLPGVAHGFLIETYGPYTAWGHAGALRQFHSSMVLMPDLDLGVFASANAADAREDVRELVRLIVEFMAPQAVPQAQTITMSEQDLRRYAGVYRSNRRPYHGAGKAVVGLTSDVVVQAHADGSLRVRSGGRTWRYLPIGPHLFQEEGGNQRMQFLMGADGTVTGYAWGSGIAVMERVGLLERARTLFLLLAAVAVLAVVRLWPARCRPRRLGAPGAPVSRVRRLARSGAVVWLLFLVLGAIAAHDMARAGSGLVFTWPTRWLLAAMLAATLAALLTLAEVLALVPVWRGHWGAGAKLRYTLGVAVLALAVWVLWNWNLIGLRT